MIEQRSGDTPSVQNHKRQMTWQILVPFGVITALIITGAVLVTTGGSTGTRVWADVSTIWLIAPMLIFALLFAAILVALIYGLAKLIGITPRYTGKAQEIVVAVSTGTRKVADEVTKPVVWTQQVVAAIKSFFHKA